MLLFFCYVSFFVSEVKLFVRHTFVCVCVCVCVSVRACVRAYVHAGVRAGARMSVLTVGRHKEDMKVIASRRKAEGRQGVSVSTVAR